MRALRALALGLAVLLVPVAAPAQIEAPATYSGDVWNRPRLTGDWGGLRNDMAKRGVAFDVDWLQILQGVIRGGREEDFGYWGLADYRLNVDTGKLGRWPGGFLGVHAMSSYGTSVNRPAGTLAPVNAAALFPAVAVDDPATALMKLTFAQFLAPWLGVYAGKIETLDGDANAFAHDFRTQFLNMGLQFNLANILVPVSAWGGGVVAVPWEGAVFQAGVLDPNGRPTDNSFDDVFQDGVVVGAEGRVTIMPFGLMGHQLLGFTWSNKDRASLRQDPSNLARLLLEERFPRLTDPGPVLRRMLERFFPQLLVPAAPFRTESETWTVYYNFDQYLWSPRGDPQRGLGVFFRFGISDGHANPVKYHFNAGIGGNGIVPGRPHDTFGIGWSRLDFSDDLVPFLRQRLHLGLEREDAFELYYNAAVTRWLGVSLDLQIVEPALKRALSSSGQLKDVKTTVVPAVRAYVRF